MKRRRGAAHATVAEMERVLENAELLYDRAHIDKAVDQLAVRISVALYELNPVLVCVMNGGIALTGDLLLRLHFPLELDYVHATRYGNTTSGDTVQWRGAPQVECRDRTVLIVDDILDEGITLAAVVARYRDAGAASVYSAVMVRKELDTSRPVDADFVALECPNRYVFGRGMDYRGYWRNLPNIYALKESVR